MRLNSPHYSKKTFNDAGIAVADLFFEVRTPPPVDVVAKFMAIAEASPGAIAVHCRAGLGRTGTLIALYMMKHHGFTAREAIAWLRIARPGSVIGPQQHFLCEREALIRRSREPLHRPPAAASSLEATEALIDEIVHSYDVRYALALSAATSRGGPPAAGPGATEATRLLAQHVAAASERRNGARAAGRA
jgi:protein-tyrosine phosphatase